MIEIALFFAAGFLAASLIALFALPFMTGHAARSAARKVRESMPFSADEISAEKDQLRAEHAVALRKLEIQLQKQSEELSAQNIELNGIREKFDAANKIGKAGKLALEEMRSKEHDLNERLRQRDAQYAGLEQRSRQMLRENRELKLALRKEGVAMGALSAAGAQPPLQQGPSLSKTGLPIAVETLADFKKQEETPENTADERGNLRAELLRQRQTNDDARQKIAELQAQLAAALERTPAQTHKTPRLPKASIPQGFAGRGMPDTKPAGMDDSALALAQDRLLIVAAQIAGITAALEGENSPIPRLLSDARQDNPGSLSARMKVLLEQTQKTYTGKEENGNAPGRTPPIQQDTGKPAILAAEEPIVAGADESIAAGTDRSIGESVAASIQPLIEATADTAGIIEVEAAKIIGEPITAKDPEPVSEDVSPVVEIEEAEAAEIGEPIISSVPTPRSADPAATIIVEMEEAEIAKVGELIAAQDPGPGKPRVRAATARTEGQAKAESGKPASTEAGAEGAAGPSPSKAAPARPSLPRIADEELPRSLQRTPAVKTPRAALARDDVIEYDDTDGIHLMPLAGASSRKSAKEEV